MLFPAHWLVSSEVTYALSISCERWYKHYQSSVWWRWLNIVYKRYCSLPRVKNDRLTLRTSKGSQLCSTINPWELYMFSFVLTAFCCFLWFCRRHGPVVTVFFWELHDWQPRFEIVSLGSNYIPHGKYALVTFWAWAMLQLWAMLHKCRENSVNSPP